MIVEDVLVQLGSLIFLVDFIILDFNTDLEVLFILGCPILAIGKALIDVAEGQLIVKAHNKVDVFDVYKAMKLSAIYKEFLSIIVIDLEYEFYLITSKYPLERALVGYFC